MVLLPCWLKGTSIRLQGDPKGIAAGEYAFICTQPSVSREQCLECTEENCEYGYGFIENKRLRRKVINYVYDASLDDELLLAGLIPSRQLKIYRSRGPKEIVYSKPTLDKKTGQTLMTLEHEARAAFELYRAKTSALTKAVDRVQTLKKRVILDKKEHKL